MEGHSGELTTRLKKVFQNKLHSSADKILFEFDHFFKLQNVIKSWIHFIYMPEGSLYSEEGGGGGGDGF